MTQTDRAPVVASGEGAAPVSAPTPAAGSEGRSRSAASEGRSRSAAELAVRRVLRPVAAPVVDACSRSVRRVVARRQRRAGFFEPEAYLAQYRAGRFPLANAVGRIRWTAPDLRAVVPVDERLHVPRNIAKALRTGRFEIRYDTAFAEVLDRCAVVADRARCRRPWLTPDAVRVYRELHERGIAHSVEAWQDGRLVGGEFGIALGGFYSGDSTFHLVPNAGKAALAHVAQRLRERGFLLHDSQTMTSVSAQFGAYEMPRADYEERLAAALAADVAF